MLSSLTTDCIVSGFELLLISKILITSVVSLDFSWLVSFLEFFMTLYAFPGFFKMCLFSAFGRYFKSSVFSVYWCIYAMHMVCRRNIIFGLSVC